MSLENFDWSKHTHIGLDLDETLAASHQDMLEKLQARGFFQKFTFDDFVRFDWENLEWADVDHDELQKFWNHHQLSDCLPISGTNAWIEILERQEKILFCITARNEIHHQEETLAWTKIHFPNIQEDHIFFANHSTKDHTPKSLLCQKINITLMIDDAIHNAEDLVNNGIVCILIEKPWNRNSDFSHPLLYRVKDWWEIIESLKKYV